MAEPLLKTPRLYLRKYAPEDYPLLVDLYNDWKWNDVNDEFAREFLCNTIQKQYELGGGVFATFLQENDLYIGHCGVKCLQKHREWHLSFRFLKTYWKNNLPAEAIKACLTFGFLSLNLNEIIVDLEERNKAAAKMLQSVGFKHRISFEENGTKLLRHSIFS